MNKRGQKTKKATGSIRIIAGKHRGRKLSVIDAQGLRPTTDRVKETVFNWLMPYLQDASCLDCFAGAGSLTFEAISRGVASAVAIELNGQAASQLENNKQVLQANNLTIEQGDALTHLKQPNQQFDIVFVDPPFNQQLVAKTIAALNNGWLAEDALIYIEMESNTPLDDLPANWQLIKEKIAGQVAFRLFQTQ
ncbi:16S rRNA (guanine(966)-N(2))-methyltransferase RsmD [Thalassotalea agarivorans]|uniref:Ribosomal RNA small subunit methyltransferase D n=1 Tax=Thalassotalea agarivorans TaxID=349064 RepID=A0A1I0EB75_THASX|nr:16S rRNA (guanine(966)-N(2))-methyltransferase RsmD [Thalassotalea agarivorans]SET42285.1 16S rRNA m(2)G-966 methyltransferase [Thalassotalea agarivorans]